VFNSLTDAEALKMVRAGRGGQRLILAVLQGTVLEHPQEVYGYVAVYLRRNQSLSHHQPVPSTKKEKARNSVRVQGL
jgi:hypothetical protein